MTRWHGTMIGSGLAPFARPTARAPPGSPNPPRQLAVGNGLAIGNGLQRLPHRQLERRAAWRERQAEAAARAGEILLAAARAPRQTAPRRSASRPRDAAGAAAAWKCTCVSASALPTSSSGPTGESVSYQYIVEFSVRIQIDDVTPARAPRPACFGRGAHGRRRPRRHATGASPRSCARVASRVRALSSSRALSGRSAPRPCDAAPGRRRAGRRARRARAAPRTARSRGRCPAAPPAPQSAASGAALKSRRRSSHGARQRVQRRRARARDPQPVEVRGGELRGRRKQVREAVGAAHAAPCPRAPPAASRTCGRRRRSPAGRALRARRTRTDPRRRECANRAAPHQRADERIGRQLDADALRVCRQIEHPPRRGRQLQQCGRRRARSRAARAHPRPAARSGGSARDRPRTRRCARSRARRPARRRRPRARRGSRACAPSRTAAGRPAAAPPPRCCSPLTPRRRARRSSRGARR